MIAEAQGRPPVAGDLALVLSGGGARAAYQAGVLAGLARRLPGLAPRIFTGVSAGAVNAAFLAAHPGSFAEATAALTALWRELSLDRVLRTDFATLAGTFVRWGARLVSGGGPLGRRARALVDASPLRDFLAARLEGPDGTITGIHDNLECGRIAAAAVTTLRYGTGETVIWVQGRGLERWERPRRRVVRTRLAISHVIASAALPLVFPAVRLAGGWHGDGGVRLTAPFSPAIHLGAGRILAVSTRQGAAGEPPAPAQLRRYPSPAQIGGQLLDAVFLDVFDEDARRLAKVNELCRASAGAAAEGSRVIDTQLIRPSRDLCALATAHERELPRVLRFAGRGLGTAERSGSDMLTLLMFVPGYVEELLALGERDADARAEDVAGLLAHSVVR